MRQIPEIEQLSEKLKDNYYIDLEVPALLDYTSLLGKELEPLNEENPTPTILSYFVDYYFERLINIKPDRLLKSEVENDIHPVQGIQDMGYDLQKFWYLSLFIYDLACGYASKNMEDNVKTPREAIEDLAISILKNITISDVLGENDKVVSQSYSGNAELVLKVNGKEHLITDNAKNLFYIGAAALSESENYTKGSTLDKGVGNSISNDYIENFILNRQEDSKSYLITYFYELFQMFFKLKPPKKVKSFSKKKLISIMVYVFKIDSNPSFLTNEGYINGYIKKQYRNREFKRSNANYWFVAKPL